MQSCLHMHVVVAHPQDGSDSLLVVHIQVTCEVCGDRGFTIAGHHIKPLMDLLQSVIDKVDPALVESGEIREVEETTTTFGDPRNN